MILLNLFGKVKYVNIAGLEIHNYGFIKGFGSKLLDINNINQELNKNHSRDLLVNKSYSLKYFNFVNNNLINHNLIVYNIIIIKNKKDLIINSNYKIDKIYVLDNSLKNKEKLLHNILYQI